MQNNSTIAAFKTSIRKYVTLYYSVIRTEAKANPGLRERIQRQRAIAEIRFARKKWIAGASDGDNVLESLIQCMTRRYDEFNEQYETQECRAVEWFTLDWKEFVEEEFLDRLLRNSQNNVIVNNPSDWSFDKVSGILATLKAFRSVEDKHEAAMENLFRLQSQTHASVDQETEGNTDGGANNKGVPKVSAKEAVVIIMSLLHEAIEEGATAVDEPSLTRLLHYLTGKSSGNLHNEIFDWINNRTKDHNGNLVAIKSMLDDLGLGFELKNLNLAIRRGEKDL